MNGSKVHHLVRRSALTLIEVVAATMIVSLMAVAALNALGAATRSAESIGNRAVALGLADDLMSEILPLAYRDPDDSPTFGPEGAESAGPRTKFDDVDDYHGWNQLPPQYRDGTAIPNRTDWRRRVEVSYVQRDNPPLGTAGNVDQGVKRVRVIVEFRGDVLAEQIALRTDAE
jgi:type II secretory pathway pseudopilin PulG